jgi:hypothetical protein
MSDYNIMNQIYFSCRKKINFMRNRRPKVMLGDTEIKTTLSECELYIYEKSISLAFKQAPHELSSLYRTKVMMTFSRGSVPKNAIFFNDFALCNSKTA